MSCSEPGRQIPPPSFFPGFQKLFCRPYTAMCPPVLLSIPPRGTNELRNEVAKVLTKTFHIIQSIQKAGRSASVIVISKRQNIRNQQELVLCLN